MGVTGLWRLIEPAGKPVPVETLENKVLAVDISIWLHQVVKAYQDARGAPMPNAHLIGLFQRLCKLLYFRIKPIFVFDGVYPELKKETIAKRQDNKTKYNSESERLKREIVLLLSKRTAIGSILGTQTSPKKAIRPNSIQNVADDDLFKLPALPQREDTESESDEDTSSSGSMVDLHTVDVESDKFKNLPVKEKYDLLIELKETRKMNSWGKLHELPKKSDNFSEFQMKRLLKRRKVQKCLEVTEKEIGGNCMSLNELESLLNEEGIDTKIDSLPTQRIASNNTKSFILIKDVKQTLEEARNRQLENKAKLDNVQPSTSKHDIIPNNTDDNIIKEQLEDSDDELKKAIEMSMECVNDANASISETSTHISSTSKSDDSMYSTLDTSYSDSDEEDLTPPDMTSAKAYIMQYSDFTKHAINKIVSEKKSVDKPKVKKVDELLKELNEEQSFTTERITLSSSEEETSIDEINISSNTSYSVTCVENLAPDVITLDSTLEEEESNSKENINCVDNIKTTNIVQHNISESDHENEEFKEIAENTVGVTKSLKFNLKDNTDSKTNVINADILQDAPHNISDSDSNNEDFEEVIDDNTGVAKPVVQLSINVGEAPDDDIFADIFKTNLNEDIVSDQATSEANISQKDDPKILVKPKESNDQLVKNNNSRPTVKNMGTKNSEQSETHTSTDYIMPSQKESVADLQAGNKPEPLNEVSREKLNSMADTLLIEENNLLKEKSRLDRIGRNITEQMTKEVQVLLQIFGIPYIVAPMEAEAQCAFLESVKLTDGTITDDSDIWLFGGQTVYRNFFNQKKHVLQFLSERIEKSFNLNREQLVLLALLVGSDYTTGVTGVGPVTALEILASFPCNRKGCSSDTPRQERYNHLVGGLYEFKKWVRTGRRTDNTSLKKKLRNVTVSDDFPSVRVVQAYLEPNIEKSEERFTWGELDITVLRDFTKSKFGWSQNKLDEIINPVVKRLLEGKTQKTLQDYFKRKIEFQTLDSQMSKRVKAAIQKMGPEETKKADEDANKEGEEAKIETIDKRRKLKRKLTKEVGNKKDQLNNVIESRSKGELSSIPQKSNTKPLFKKVIVNNIENTSSIEIPVPKLDRYQEIIPQREKDRAHVLQNKLKAIEVFRKSKIDKKSNRLKRKIIVPKEKAELSESDTD